jgi:hypothetical protein
MARNGSQLIEYVTLAAVMADGGTVGRQLSYWQNSWAHLKKDEAG